MSSVAALTADGSEGGDDGSDGGPPRPRRLTREASRSLAAAVVRRWTTAEGDPDFDAYAAGLFDFYGGGAFADRGDDSASPRSSPPSPARPPIPELLGIEEEEGGGGADSDSPARPRAARSFSEVPQAASVMRLAEIAGGGPEGGLLAPGDTWDIGYELLSPCKACGAGLRRRACWSRTADASESGAGSDGGPGGMPD